MMFFVITCQVTSTVMSDKTVQSRLFIEKRGRAEGLGDCLNFE